MSNLPDGLSPTFCWSKQYAVKIDIPALELNDGCCRVPPTALSEKDLLALNVTDILNTPELQHDRKELLEGIQSTSCQSCWDTERHTPYSRRYKDNRKIDDLVTPDTLTAIKPALRKQEIVLGNTCTFNCMYCSGIYSSTIAKDLRQHGPYSLIPGAPLSPAHLEETKNVIDLETQVTDSLLSSLESLQYLVLSGGEPTLSKNFWTILRACGELSAKPRTLAIVSNGMYSESTLVDLIQAFSTLHAKGWTLHIDLSVDTAHKDAEYIRVGLNYARFLEVRQRLLKALPYLNLNVAITTSSFIFPNLDTHIDILLYSVETLDRSVVHFTPLDDPYILAVDRLPYAMRKELVEAVDDVFAKYGIQDTVHTVAFGWEHIKQRLLVPGVYQDNYGYLLRQYVQERDKRLGTDGSIFTPFIQRLLNEH